MGMLLGSVTWFRAVLPQCLVLDIMVYLTAKDWRVALIAPPSVKNSRGFLGFNLLFRLRLCWTGIRSFEYFILSCLVLFIRK